MDNKMSGFLSKKLMKSIHEDQFMSALCPGGSDGAKSLTYKDKLNSNWKWRALTVFAIKTDIGDMEQLCAVTDFNN